MNSDNTNSKLKEGRLTGSPLQNSKLVDDGWLEVGTIVAAQGLGGEVRVYSNSDFPERFEEPGDRWLLCPDATEPRAVKLLKGRFIPGKGLFAVELAGVEDRNQAEALRGCRLLVPEGDRPKLGEDEYHVLDLIGLEVFNQLTQEVLGKVVDVIPAGNDLLEVETLSAKSLSATSLQESSANVSANESDTASTEVVTTGKKRKPRPKLPKPVTVLIPFVKAIVPVVDLKAGRVEITPPPGLLEIT